MTTRRVPGAWWCARCGRRATSYADAERHAQADPAHARIVMHPPRQEPSS